MDIKLFVGDKELISPEFDFRINETKNILMLCINNFTNKEQEVFSEKILVLEKSQLIINSNYIALNFNDVIYFFDLTSNKEHHIENLLISGSYDFMFAFVDINHIITEQKYLVIKLNGHPIKELGYSLGTEKKY